MAARSSSRIKDIVQRQGVRPLDEQARQRAKRKQYEALERDNQDDLQFDLDAATLASAAAASAAASSGGGVAGDDDADEDDEVFVSGTGTDKKKRKKKVVSGKSSARAVPRSFAEFLFQNNISPSSQVHSHVPNYFSAAAAPSKYPSRSFCSVCGFFGKYECLRCGLKSCSARCDATHKETRCQKFG